VETKNFIKKSNKVGIKGELKVENRIYHAWAGIEKVHPIDIKIICK